MKSRFESLQYLDLDRISVGFVRSRSWRDARLSCDASVSVPLFIAYLKDKLLPWDYLEDLHELASSPNLDTWNLLNKGFYLSQYASHNLFHLKTAFEIMLFTSQIDCFRFIFSKP